MVRAEVVTIAAVAALIAAGAAAQTRQTPQRPQPAPAAAPAIRPFEALLPRIAAVAPGTYIVDGAIVSPAPDAARVPVLLQADVLRGSGPNARVGIVVGAEAAQPIDVRLRISTVATGGQPSRVVADAGGAAAAGPIRLVREFSLPGGEYDLEAVAGPSAPGAAGSITVARSRLDVPDVRSGTLVLTPIVMGESDASARKTDVPFIFGGTALAPAIRSDVAQDGAVSVAFRIYNWTAKAEEKPDVTVEYLFYERGTKGLHFFNKVKPQQLNGETLGESFDPSVGFLAAGMKIPLSAFTFGEFQLTVRATDNRSRQTAERHLAFVVRP